MDKAMPITPISWDMWPQYATITIVIYIYINISLVTGIAPLGRLNVSVEHL